MIKAWKMSLFGTLASIRPISVKNKANLNTEKKTNAVKYIFTVWIICAGIFMENK